MLTVGSLFSGIGGIDLGLELAGMKVRWQVEIDPWCQRVLEKHWPNVDRLADVRHAGAHNLERVDLIAGGFPCQDISDAGKRGGITAARSGLWTHFARIIRELRPRYVLVENVAALRFRGLDVVLRDLSESGYDAEWDCIPASAVGAPHRRDRLWIVAYADRGRVRDELRGPVRRDTPLADLAARGEAVADASRDALLGKASAQRAIGERTREGREPGDVANAAGGRRNTWGGTDGEAGRWRSRGSLAGSDDVSGGWWLSEPNVGRVAHGVPARVDRLRGLGNAVVPQVVEWIGRRIVEAEAAA